jgi:hypothetical protein
VASVAVFCASSAMAFARDERTQILLDGRRGIRTCIAARQHDHRGGL